MDPRIARDIASERTAETRGRLEESLEVRHRVTSIFGRFNGPSNTYDYQPGERRILFVVILTMLLIVAAFVALIVVVSPRQGIQW